MYPLDFNSASLTALIDLMSDMTKPVHFRLFSCCEATASTAATATSTTSTHKNFCFPPATTLTVEGGLAYTLITVDLLLLARHDNRDCFLTEVLTVSTAQRREE